MSITLKRKGSYTTPGYYNPDNRTKVLYYRMESGGISLIEMPATTDLANIKSVKIVISEKESQICVPNGKPETIAIYTLVRKMFPKMEFTEVSELESKLRKQLNLNAYDFTIAALNICGKE